MKYLDEKFLSDFYEANGTIEVTFGYSSSVWPLGDSDLIVNPLLHLITCADPDLSQGYPMPIFKKGPLSSTITTRLGADMMYMKCKYAYYAESVESAKCGTVNELGPPTSDAPRTLDVQCETVENSPCLGSRRFESPVCGQINDLRYVVVEQDYDNSDSKANLTLKVNFQPIDRPSRSPTLFYLALFGPAVPYRTKEEETFLGVNVTDVTGVISSCIRNDPAGNCLERTTNDTLVVRGVHPKQLYGITVCAVKDARNVTLPDILGQSRNLKPKADPIIVGRSNDLAEQQGGSSGGWIAAVVVGGVVLLIAAAALLLLLMRRSHLKKERLYKLKIAHINETNAANQYTDLPKKSDLWEFERRNLIIHTDKKLGSGAFGAVYLGKLLGKSLGHEKANSPLGINIMRSENCDVAVKMLPEYADEQSRGEFLREITLMKTLGYHERLVNMLACVTASEPICLVVEYCSDGDLLHFLRDRCKYMMKLDELGINYREGELDESVDLDMIVTVKQLIQYSVQIASGMEYLAQKGFIHRDVAARNVLIHDKKFCKIGDFGLCRYVYADQAQYKSKGGRLPLKWMSPEAIRNYEFSSKSDVWSFGVLLFEIITLGGAPYPGMPPEDVLPFLESGQRIRQPDNCPDQIYDIMHSCWNSDDDLRPDFGEVRLSLAKQLEDMTEDYSYLKLDSAKDYYNFQYEPLP